MGDSENGRVHITSQILLKCVNLNKNSCLTSIAFLDNE